MTKKKQQEENVENTQSEETEQVHMEEPEVERIEKGMEESANEFKELAQRIQADFDNFRKRNSSVRADAHRDGIVDAVKALLPVLDSMEAALKIYAGQDEKKEMQEGYQKLVQQFLSQLNGLGVKQIESQQVPFDPNVHEAILRQPKDGVESGRVIETYRNGYMIEGVVIRPSQVIVSE